jgi:hypothetical protein
MVRISLIARFFAVVAIISLPMAIVLGVCSIRLVPLAFVIGFLLMLGAMVFGPKIILSFYKAKTFVPGLQRTLERALDSDGALGLPEVFVFSTPAPEIFVLRGLFHRGVIVLSQGLLAITSEDKLRAIFREQSRLLQEPGLPFRSAVFVFVSLLLSLAPVAWTRFLLAGRLSSDLQKQLSPWRFVGFMLLFPLASLLDRLKGAKCP